MLQIKQIKEIALSKEDVEDAPPRCGLSTRDVVEPGFLHDQPRRPACDRSRHQFNRSIGWPGWGHRSPRVLASKNDPEYTLAAPAEINSLFHE